MDPIAVEVVPAIGRIDAASWNACAGEPPFLSHELLHALEESGSAVAEEGWLPQHLAIYEGGRLVGAAPVYVKGHSYGEYVFDFAWASAHARANKRYYPKIQCCVPFTPVTGPRLLVHPEADHDRIQSALCGAMVELAERHGLSSAHLTFLPETEQDRCAELGLLRRYGVQFHWHNRGYGSFDDFLGALLGRKRKAIKKERREAAASGVALRVLSGEGLKSEHWDAFYAFYVDTIDRKWGSPYLTRAFFEQIGETMADRIVLLLGEKDGDWVCGALNFRDDRALYGRYWGCRGHFPSLHFEACYHRAVQYAIDHGLERVEAGAQGAHKIQRGYVPVRTHSAHHLADPRLSAAIGDFLERERRAVDADIAALRASSPYRDDRHG